MSDTKPLYIKQIFTGTDLIDVFRCQKRIKYEIVRYQDKYNKIWFNCNIERFSYLESDATLAEIYKDILLYDAAFSFDLMEDEQPIEINEQAYDYFLNVLPPHNWNRSSGYFEMSEVYTHNSKGEAIRKAFEQKGGKFYVRRPKGITDFSRKYHI